MIISMTKKSKKTGEFMIILQINGQSAMVMTKVLITLKQLTAAFKFGRILICKKNIKC